MRTAVRRGMTAAALWLPAAVFARAGGGQHGAATSSSHSHDTSSGGGSGDSIGGLIALLIIVLLFSYFVRRMRNRPSQQGGMGSPQAQAAMATLGQVIGASNLARIALGDLAPAANTVARPAPLAAIDAIRSVDPGFELESFLQRAEMTFFLVKRGIQKNDAAAIRPYLNDAMFDPVSRSIAQSTSQHRHALLESLNVRGMAIEEATCDAQGQRIRVHFDLVYRAKTLDDANRVLEDEGTDRPHAEQWTFIRSASARTAINGGVIAARCPTCGAELRLNLDGTCAHCKASVTNGSVDWVVSEVRPAAFQGFSGGSVLGVRASSIAEGIATLTQADKDFSMGLFQGRVQTAFLALQQAWCNQKLDAGRAFLSPGAYFAWSAQLETLAAEGRRNIMEGLSVRDIQPISIVHGRVFDDITVRISAVAADFEVDQTNNIVFGDRTVRPFAEDWTFQRSVGVATSSKAGTLESTCPRCGAPLQLTQIGECRYCKAAVTSGKFDWVVSRIDQEEAASAASADPGVGVGSAGEAIALRVGGAIVGGLLSSFLSDRDD